jgi:arylsulfotransferase ASST
LRVEWSRRDFLTAAGIGTAWIALVGTSSCESSKRAPAATSPARGEQTWTFRSRSDLRPPVIRVTTQAYDTAPGDVFVAPKNGPGESHPGQDGCMILDNSGQPVWLRLLQNEDMDVMDFKVQRYRGEPVLTFWEGVHLSYGQGEYVILDGSYQEVGRVRAGNGLQGDHHEFLISPQDTALFTIYHKVPMDLSAVGGRTDSWVLDGIAQEVDIATGEVLFEWHSLEHIGLEESYRKPSKDSRAAFDYFHINSIEVDRDSNLLVSAKGTCTVYKINRTTGEVLWQLGGKRSSFEMGPGTRTAWQHDARRQPDGTITIFDNGADPKVHDQSRAIVVKLDEDEMTATLLREYTHPDRLLAGSQGNMQVLSNFNVFVGWGSEPVLSEFNSGGELLFSADFPTESESYRAFRFPWSGRPQDEPAIAAETGPEDEVTVYASWNGATEVATWQVLAGPGPERLEAVASAPRKGFETAITLNTTEPYVRVQAKTASGKVLGTSRALRPRSQER